MIREKTTITTAVCDACEADLTDTETFPGTTMAHYGQLVNHFGFGSSRDNCGQQRKWDLCGECWDTALKAIGLPVCPREADDGDPR